MINQNIENIILRGVLGYDFLEKNRIGKDVIFIERKSERLDHLKKELQLPN